MKNKRQWIIGIVGAIIVILAGIVWYLGQHWKSIIRTKLEESVRTSTKGLYKLSYDSMELNLLSGSIALKNIELLSDSAVYRTQVQRREAPDNRIHVKLKSLNISGVGVWSALVAKKLHMREIAFDHVDVHLITESHDYSQSHDSIAVPLHERIKDMFHTVHIQRSTIDNLNLKLSNMQNGRLDTTSIDRIRVRLDDIIIDENGHRDTTRMVYTKEIEVEIPEFVYDIPNSVYKISFDRCIVNTRQQQALLTKVALHPRITKQKYFETDKQNKAMIVLKWDTLRLEKLNLQDMLDNQRIFARYAYLKGGSASFHKDKRYQEDNVNKIGQAPHQQVMKMGQTIRFDTVFVDNTDVSYHEYSGEYDREGSISFEHAKGTITNLTNDTVQLSKDRFMRADLQARVMGSGRLHARFGFDMLSKVGSHTYAGTLGSMQASAFNRILTPLRNLEFSSGNIHGIRFDMQATDYMTRGMFRFDYDEMKIDLLHVPKDNTEQSKKGVLSFLVNAILIRDSNPDADKVYLVGNVEHTRVPEYSHFKTIWKSLEQGIFQCVGIGKGAERETKETDKKPEEDSESKSFLKKTGDFFRGLFKKEDD